MKEQQTLFKVRDLRQKTQFKIDDLYLNGYVRVCGKDASLVYMSLCRHAEFNSQKAFPSQDKIAFELGVSSRTVRRGVKKLMEYNIILAEKERKQGKFANYIYTLLDKSEWKSASGQNRPMVKPADKSHRWLATGGLIPTKDNKEQRITNTKDTNNTADLKIGRVKNNIELLVDYFFELKEWDNRPKIFYRKNNIPPYSRFLKPAKDLLELCDNDLIRSEELLDKTKEWVEGFGGEDWQIETAIKKYLEIGNKDEN